LKRLIEKLDQEKMKLVEELKTSHAVRTDYDDDAMRLAGQGLGHVAEIAKNRAPVKDALKDLPRLLYPDRFIGGEPPKLVEEKKKGGVEQYLDAQYVE